MTHIIDRMNDAREAADIARASGRHTGKRAAGWGTPYREPDDWQELLELKMQFALMSAVNELNWELAGGREAFPEIGDHDEIPF